MLGVTLGLAALQTGLSLYQANQQQSAQEKANQQRAKELEASYQRQKAAKETEQRLNAAKTLSSSYFNLLNAEESKKKKSLNEYSTYY